MVDIGFMLGQAPLLPPQSLNDQQEERHYITCLVSTLKNIWTVLPVVMMYNGFQSLENNSVQEQFISCIDNNLFPSDTAFSSWTIAFIELLILANASILLGIIMIYIYQENKSKHPLRAMSTLLEISLSVYYIGILQTFSNANCADEVLRLGPDNVKSVRKITTIYSSIDTGCENIKQAKILICILTATTMIVTILDMVQHRPIFSGCVRLRTSLFSTTDSTSQSSQPQTQPPTSAHWS